MLSLVDVKGLPGVLYTGYYKELPKDIISIAGDTKLGVLKDDEHLECVSGNASIGIVKDNTTIKVISGHATIWYMYDNARVDALLEHAGIWKVGGDAKVNELLDRSWVTLLHENGCVLKRAKDARIFIHEPSED